MPTQSMLDRYEAHRTRRFLKNEELTAQWLPAGAHNTVGESLPAASPP